VKKLMILKEMDERGLSLLLKVKDSGVLLMMDAIYLANSEDKRSSPVRIAVEEGKEIFILRMDAERRGLTEKLVKGVKQLSYDDFVDLLFNGATINNM
jgi:sulfur relay protein TusB/DsrH